MAHPQPGARRLAVQMVAIGALVVVAAFAAGAGASRPPGGEGLDRAKPFNASACTKGKPKCAQCSTKSKCSVCQNGYQLPACKLCSPGRQASCTTGSTTTCTAANLNCDPCGVGSISLGGNIKKAKCFKCPEGMTSNTDFTLCIVDVCAAGNNNCSADATCAAVGDSGSFSCTCNSGFTGDGVTCTPFDPCAAGNNNCSADATCAAAGVDFTCTCKSGFTGDGVTCTPIDPCAPGNNDCNANATCAAAGGGFTCTCKSGFTGDGVTCTPNDPCAPGNNNCSANATCAAVGNSGGFTCTCKSGFTGDGVTCTPNDPCAPGNNNCSANATCAAVGNSGGFTCTCKSGFTGDGVTCTPDGSGGGNATDPCAPGNNNCSANATCAVAGGSFTCTCKSGFTGDGVTCTPDGGGNAGPCAAGNGGCHANATCTAFPDGTRSCTCNGGFAGDGATCTAQDPACNVPITFTCISTNPTCRYYQYDETESGDWSSNVHLYLACNASSSDAGVQVQQVQYEISMSNGSNVLSWFDVPCPKPGSGAVVTPSAQFYTADFTQCTARKPVTFVVTTDEVPPCDPPKTSTLWPCSQTTGCWLDTMDREKVTGVYQAVFAPHYGPIMMDMGWEKACMHKGTWTGGDVDTCQPGVNSEALKQWTLAMLNYFRAMAGVAANVSRYTDYDDDVLASALIQSANKALSHSPAQTSKCWTQLGADASRANLYLGVRGITATKGFIYDPGENNKEVGHRTHMIYPNLQWSTTGDIASSEQYMAAQALSVITAPDPPGWTEVDLKTRDGYVAWPPPGFVPASLVYRRWSFYLFEAGGGDTDISTATVTMTKDGTSIPSPVIGGGGNKLVWEPNDESVFALADRHYQPKNDIVYEVTIADATSAKITIKYNVTVFGVDGLAFGSDANIGLHSSPPPAQGRRAAGAGAEERDYGIVI